MKKYPVTAQKLRERICANNECGDLFSPKNDKAIYCSPECKNRAGYLRLQEEFSEEFKWFKDFLHNRNVLATLYQGGNNIITNDVLKAFKFRPQIGTVPEMLIGKGIVIPYGKYALCSTDQINFEIIKF